MRRSLRDEGAKFFPGGGIEDHITFPVLVTTCSDIWSVLF
jgi:hypothetical protein